MTSLLHGNCQLSSGCSTVHGSTNLSSRPERSAVEKSAVSLPLSHTPNPLRYVLLLDDQRDAHRVLRSTRAVGGVHRYRVGTCRRSGGRRTVATTTTEHRQRYGSQQQTPTQQTQLTVPAPDLPGSEGEAHNAREASPPAGIHGGAMARNADRD